MARELRTIKRCIAPTINLLTALTSPDEFEVDAALAISRKNKIYMLDVLDHMKIIVDTVNSLEEDSKNLIDLVCLRLGIG